MKNLALFLVALLLTITLSEALLRQFPQFSAEPGSNRYLYYSENPWIRTETPGDWIVKNPPNAAIETFARYGDETDFSYVFYTNQYGFRYTDCAGETTENIIPVIGDSYTHGSGGDNWLNETNTIVSESGNQYCFLNAGVGATGFSHWLSLIPHIEEIFEPDFLVMVFISNDILRKKWYARTKNNRIVFCIPGDELDDIENETCREANIFTAKDHEQFVSKMRHRNLLERVLPATFGLVARARRAFKNEPGNADEQHAAQERELARLMDEFRVVTDRKILAIRIKTKRELISGYKPYAGIVDRPNAFYREAECGLNLRDFHHNDGHPHSAGYSKIAVCIARELQEFSRSLSGFDG